MGPLTSIRGLVPGLSAAQELQRGAQLAGLGGISPAGETTGIQPGPGVGGIKTAPGAGASFNDVLGRFVSEVNSKQVNANASVRDMQAGGATSLHEAMIAMEEASVSFQMMVEVRNKLLESYQEMMRMQV